MPFWSGTLDLFLLRSELASRNSNKKKQTYKQTHKAKKIKQYKDLLTKLLKHTLNFYQLKQTTATQQTNEESNKQIYK